MKSGAFLAGENMDRLDRLILKAKPKLTPVQLLAVDNLYLGKSFDELLDMLCPESVGEEKAPEMRTPDWGKFMYALVNCKR